MRFSRHYENPIGFLVIGQREEYFSGKEAAKNEMKKGRGILYGAIQSYQIRE